MELARRHAGNRDRPHVAFALRKGRIISVGVNSFTKSSNLQRSCATAAGKPMATFLHAEIDALLGTGGKLADTLVVIRLNKRGIPMLAKPCPICQLAIQRYGVKNVEHS